MWLLKYMIKFIIGNGSHRSTQWCQSKAKCPRSRHARATAKRPTTARRSLSLCAGIRAAFRSGYQTGGHWSYSAGGSANSTGSCAAGRRYSSAKWSENRKFLSGEQRENIYGERWRRQGVMQGEIFMNFVKYDISCLYSMCNNLAINLITEFVCRWQTVWRRE